MLYFFTFVYLYTKAHHSKNHKIYSEFIFTLNGTSYLIIMHGHTAQLPMDNELNSPCVVCTVRWQLGPLYTQLYMDTKPDKIWILKSTAYGR